MASSNENAGTIPTSHPTGFWFFFWGEFAERCSYYGMRAILALYMTQKLGVSEGDAGTFMSLFIAMCYFFPLVGGWIADNFLGKYWTIVLFSVPYVASQFLVGIENKYVVIASLIFLAMGSGVIKPNISTLMGTTYDQLRPGQDQLRSSAFSWFYMAINIGAFLSQISMPWLRDNYGYKVAFMFPAILMAIALLIFASGKRFYGKEVILRKVVGDPSKGPIADGKTLTGIPVRTTIVSAEEKAQDKKLKLQTLERIGLLFVTVMFFWAIFDQSASTWIFFANTYMNCELFGYYTAPDSIQAFNSLFIVLLVPVSVLIFKKFPMKPTNKIALGFGLTMLSMVIMSLSGFLAGEATKATRIEFPEGVLFAPGTTEAALKDARGSIDLGGIKLSADEFKFDETKKKMTVVSGSFTLNNGQSLTFKNGHLEGSAGTDGGMLESNLKTGDQLKNISSEPAAATIEITDWVKPAERVTVWWQVLAYLILTVGEILVSITGLELAFVAAPSSMKSFVTACWLAVVFLANLLINAPITRLYPKMPPGYYFAILALFMFLILLVYFPIANRFNRGLEENPVT